MRSKSLARAQWVPVHRFLIAFFGTTFLISGCATNVSRPTVSNIALQNHKTFYIIQNETDNRGISRIIESELALLGKGAKAGPRMAIPNGVNAVVTYYEDWKWDMTWYLLNLLIQFRDPQTNVLLSSAASYRSSLARTEPELMVREVLEAIFK